MNGRPRKVDDLLVATNFIRAVRESGYLSVSTALAELIDNSLQASATEVAIVIRRETAGALPEIVVEDNGSGMSLPELGLCLRFGGSSRFNERESFGRFGMGLPAASLSQARHVEVTTWRNGGNEYSVDLDVDDISAGGSPRLDPRRGKRSNTFAGCRVRWQRCDRIEYKRLAWLVRSLQRDLGRIYRRFISAGGFSMTINGEPVQAVDPTFTTTTIEGASARLALDELTYELETSSGEPSFVKVRFAQLPVKQWHDLDNVRKRRVGIVGGGGVSVLRAGREIARGWFLMGGKRRENYDDWWRCEIEFEPSLDDDFGITINKQGIRPSIRLREAIEPEMETIARLLNARVRKAFEDVKFQAAADASCRAAAAADPNLPVLALQPGGGALQYRITTAALPMEAMFQSTLAQRTLNLILNADHPAFNALYKPLQTMESESAAELRMSIELFLLAFARSAAQMEQAGVDLVELVDLWSSTYGRMLLRS